MKIIHKPAKKRQPVDDLIQPASFKVIARLSGAPVS